MDAKTLATVLKAVLEVRKPSILGELIIAITFIPILALEGIEGKMFGPLALTVAIALLSSLVLSIFVIPVLCANDPETAAGKRKLHHEAAEETLSAGAPVQHEEEKTGSGHSRLSFSFCPWSLFHGWERNSSRSWMKGPLTWTYLFCPAFHWIRPWRSTNSSVKS